MPDTLVPDTPTGRHRAQKRGIKPNLRAKRPARTVSKVRARRSPTFDSVHSGAPARRSGLPFLDLLGFSDSEFEGFEPEPTPTKPRGRSNPRSAPVASTTIVETEAVREPSPAVIDKPTPTPSIFDLLPRLSELRSGGAGENTGTLIERLWEATDTYQPDTSWAPDGGEVPGRRYSWWGVLGVAVSLLVITALALTFRPDREPTVGELTPQATILLAQASIDEARSVADLIVDPGTSGEDLSNAAVTLTALDTSARELTATGQRLLEDPTQQTAGHAFIRAAAIGTSSGRRLGDALTYRLVFARAFQLPELPSTAEPTDVADLGFNLAAMLSETERSLERLPADRSFEDHRQMADTALASIERTTADYLQALRDRDFLASRVHANQIRQDVAEVHAAVLLPLREVADQVNTQLDDYTAELASAGTPTPAP